MVDNNTVTQNTCSVNYRNQYSHYETGYKELLALGIDAGTILMLDRKASTLGITMLDLARTVIREALHG